MSQVVIENPIINSPFDEPTRHFRFSDEGITDEVAVGRRTSSHFVPIAKPKKEGSKQLQFDTEWTRDRIEENKLVNDIRHRVALWRKGGYVGVTPTTARLIAYWTDPNRAKKLFFCQNEAIETAIYIVEVAKKYGDAWIENAIREANDPSNPGLPRTGFEMATGAGKTVVMAMLIAWHTLNKCANPRGNDFTSNARGKYVRWAFQARTFSPHNAGFIFPFSMRRLSSYTCSYMRGPRPCMNGMRPRAKRTCPSTASALMMQTPCSPGRASRSKIPASTTANRDPLPWAISRAMW